MEGKDLMGLAPHEATRLDLRFGTRLEILDGANIPRTSRSHCISNRGESAFFQPLDRDGIVAEVELGAH